MACQTNGVEDVIECVIIKPDPQALCDVGSYQAVSPCSESGGATSLQSEDLFPNTMYLILIGTAHDPSATPCNLSVFLSGPAVSIDACCTTNIAPGQNVELTVNGANEDLGYTWFPDYGLSTAEGTSGSGLSFGDHDLFCFWIFWWLPIFGRCDHHCWQSIGASHELHSQTTTDTTTRGM